MPETAYVVLRRTSGPVLDVTWELVASNVLASSAQAAIRKELGDLLPGDSSHAGTYVAVPARSWKPVQVSAVQQTVLRLEGAPAT